MVWHSRRLSHTVSLTLTIHPCLGRPRSQPEDSIHREGKGAIRRSRMALLSSSRCVACRARRTTLEALSSGVRPGGPDPTNYARRPGRFFRDRPHPAHGHERARLAAGRGARPKRLALTQLRCIPCAFRGVGPVLGGSCLGCLGLRGPLRGSGSGCGRFSGLVFRGPFFGGPTDSFEHQTRTVALRTPRPLLALGCNPSAPDLLLCV